MILPIEKIKQARENIKDFCKETQLIHANNLSKELGNDIYLKLENFQNSGSFKMRGACNKILSLTPEERAKGVIASSAGNHAQGVAFSATKLGIKSTIVMPARAPLAKVTATKNYGAQVVLHGVVYDDAYAKAKELQEQNDYVFVHPFDDEYVIAGQGTIGLEILEQLPSVDQVIIPIGGGGIIAGIGSAIKQLKPSVKIIGVQAEHAPAFKKSFENGEWTSVQAVPTLADGIAVSNPGKLTWDIVKDVVDEVVTVSEDEISSAILFLLERCKISAEGAGATPTAALLAGKVNTNGLKTVGMVSGGNINVTLVEKIINRGLIAQGRRCELKVNIADASGELVRFIDCISALNGNIVTIRQGNTRRGLPLNQAAVTVVIDTSGHDHLEEILANIKANGFQIL